MRSFVRICSAGLVGLAGWLCETPVSAHGTVIANFPSGDGANSSLVPNGSGAFYGTAASLNGNGAIYRLTKDGSKWHYQVLHSFNGSEGSHPYGGLIRSSATGELYGTTQDGGLNQAGTVFSFKPSDTGGTLTVLHNFFGDDGALPEVGLILDEQTGTLYGATEYGGQYNNCGTVYSLTPLHGSWTFRSLYSFHGSVDGCFPLTQLQFGPKPGTLIGATDYGYYGAGTVYQLTKTKGQWTKTTLHDFDPSNDGSEPADITVAPGGTIYGIAQKNAARYGAVVFQLAHQHGQWSYRILHKQGSEPAGLTLDRNTGTLYGATTTGGALNHGLLFKLVPMGATWSETVLEKFKNVDRYGEHPRSRPILDPITGMLIVTTTLGGKNGGGTAYAVP
jgi:uncharacterized repeat protein (TIGR03803 family)